MPSQYTARTRSAAGANAAWTMRLPCPRVIQLGAYRWTLSSSIGRQLAVVQMPKLPSSDPCRPAPHAHVQPPFQVAHAVYGHTP